MTAPVDLNGLRIGITIGLHEPNESLWINGIKQNALFLAKLLMSSPRAYRVTLVNTTATPLTDALPWDRRRFDTRPFAEAKDSLDVLIELGGQIDGEQTAYLKSRGVKIVSYCCGFEYIHATQSILFGRRLWDTLFINRGYDEIWAIPQIAPSSLPFLQSLRRCPGRVVPFVWDPMFLTARAQALRENGEYRPNGQPGRRLTVMEPNHDVVKFCVYPMLIIDEVFRREPDTIAFAHVTNAEHLAHHSREFVLLMNYLDIVRAGKASFVGRYDTPVFLSEFTDVVVSHQWENPLNYFYFDVCWQGYPLVHNAHLAADLGYYYPENDVQAGADLLARVLREHDAGWEQYTSRQRELLRRYTSENPALVADYDLLVENLVRGAG
ncbi:DUF2827 domain-containing protein [Burkholderia glumae]|uniref:DUF2827 domain-containing protein n=1 Tax=Burkholderia glumae TaxID=337 RepID=A0AAQ0BSF7_BURGL|nr:DUF2827 domain-containing protein [Burkholderia glumae]ACR30911.1 Hypothetical protein bglu_2g04560 [Burkholderia glumae BGR1]AJY64282.1 hypothetical protein KS03_5460 [Burkholderia glumae LMG 2196 = ATCC 33617]KHJ62076.1 hypothetical protein NCPPB3923_15385 [Burkholderia glumae]MCM2483776.1 DUF2827 domain-containing protein [Burkholderia glumae]MCM2494124.1 DUF2827 domain-containing protein [Burkholderia glumae]